MKLYFKFGFVVFAFIQSITYADCGSTNVKQLAKEFFTSYSGFYYEDPLQVKELLTPEFFNIIENEYKCTSQGEICAIEANPWLSAQDGEIEEPISFTIENKTTNSVSVKMSYLYVLSKTQRENREVTFLFEKISKGSCWLLADFITPKDGSLKKYIQTWQSKYGKL